MLDYTPCEEITRKAVTINPAKICQPIGAGLCSPWCPQLHAAQPRFTGLPLIPAYVPEQATEKTPLQRPAVSLKEPPSSEEQQTLKKHSKT